MHPAAESSPNGWRGVLVAAGVLTALWMILFSAFIWGNQTLLYKDVGSDSLNIFYPNYVLRSDYWRNAGLFGWSFQTGMGQNISGALGSFLISPIVWLPKAAIAKAIVYQHLFYILVAGLFFADFLAVRGLRLTSCVFGAALVAFSAYMCMGSCWYFHAYEVACFSVLLWSAERAVSRGQWLLLALGVFVIALLGSFHLYLCALLLLFYVPIRLLHATNGQWKPTVRTSVLLGGVTILGLGLTAFLSLGNFQALLNSPRGSGPTSLTRTLSSFPIFALETPLHYVTAMLRMLGNDMLGVGDDYRGWQNYLEAPMSYCGLITLLLFPQVFAGANTRQRIVYALFVVFAFGFILFPWFRFLFWGFQGNYFRVFSLFSILGFITFAATALDRFSAGERLNLCLLGTALLVMLIILSGAIPAVQSVINRQLRGIAGSFLVVYALLLVVGAFTKRQSLMTWIVLGLMAIELMVFNHFTVARPVVLKSELSQRVGYNDETVDAVRDLKTSDSSFYRITKTWGSSPATMNSASLNDALVFGYYGTASYSSFNNLKYIQFLMATDAISPDALSTFTHWSTGTLGHPILSTFTCEKYVLTRDRNAFEGNGPYKFVRYYESAALMENMMAVPLGLVFNRWLADEDFRRLPSAAKEQVLLYAAVLPPDYSRDGLDLPWRWMGLEMLRDEMNDSSPEQTIGLRRQTALKIDSFTENRITGSVSSPEPALMVLQMPFDPGWKARIDQKTEKTMEVDCGLLGLSLPTGDHKIEFFYVRPFRLLGSIISVVSLGLLIALAWWRPRISLA